MGAKIRLKNFAIALGLCFAAHLAVAQSSIRGTVTSNDGEPLIGVTVQIKNAPAGTTTDIDAMYELSASPTDTLVFSYIGFASQEIAVNGQSRIDVVLHTGLQLALTLAPT